jgi:endonuclease/exonuclease/phosphatase family metal-dependent hydrolase
VLVLFQALLPQRSGPLALTQIFEPYIVVTAIVAVPFALWRRERVGLAVVAALMVVTIGRYGPGFTTGPVDAAGVPLTVTAWNVEAGDDGGERVLKGLSGVTSDLIGLEELQPATAEAVTSDESLATAYPYRALAPDSSVLGVGLLSRYPITEQWFSDVRQPRETSAPPFMRAVVSVPDNSPTVVYVVHPLPGRFQSVLDVPVSLDTTMRDEGIATIRSMVAADLDAQRSVVVMGDINTTPREPAYVDLSMGMFDARSAGSWPGLTWRLDPFKDLPFGLLRIDYVLSNGRPSTYGVRCTPLSDHCIVSATITFPGVAR